MKNIKYILIGLLAPVLLYSCTDKTTMNNPQEGEVRENNYSTSEEAVARGKNDLLDLLKNKDFTINIDAAALEKAQPETALPLFEVNFERLLKSSNDSLASLSTNSKKINTPLVENNKVIAVIATAKNEKGWQLSEITSQALSNDLNEIRGSFQQMNIPLTIYEVPNINATLYEAKMDGRTMYFTKYKGNSLSEPIAAEVILKELISDAQIFQRKYGDELKKQKLVK